MTNNKILNYDTCSTNSLNYNVIAHFLISKHRNTKSANAFITTSSSQNTSHINDGLSDLMLQNESVQGHKSFGSREKYF